MYEKIRFVDWGVGWDNDAVVGGVFVPLRNIFACVWKVFRAFSDIAPACYALLILGRAVHFKTGSAMALQRNDPVLHIQFVIWVGLETDHLAHRAVGKFHFVRLGESIDWKYHIFRNDIYQRVCVALRIILCSWALVRSS